MTAPTQAKMPPKSGKKAAPAPFPQGKAGGSKKAPKVRIPSPMWLSQALTAPESSHREAPQELRHRPGHPTPAQPRSHGAMARIRPPPAPEEDPQHAPEGPTSDCAVPARCRPQPYVSHNTMVYWTLLTHDSCHPGFQAPQQVPP